MQGEKNFSLYNKVFLITDLENGTIDLIILEVFKDGIADENVKVVENGSKLGMYGMGAKVL